MDVIAVFPLDHKILNRKLRLFYCYLALFAIAVLFCDFILLLSLAVHEFSFFAVFIGMLLLLVVPRMILDEREERHRRERSIFKIAPRGIYLDEVNASGSTILRCRTVYRFDDIQSCSLEQTKPLGLAISQVIVRDSNGKPMLKINGLIAAQEFVETVNRCLIENRWQRQDESSFSKMFVV